jgi:hypothetical protein
MVFTNTAKFKIKFSKPKCWSDLSLFSRFTSSSFDAPVIEILCFDICSENLKRSSWSFESFVESILTELATSSLKNMIYFPYFKYFLMTLWISWIHRLLSLLNPRLDDLASFCPKLALFR